MMGIILQLGTNQGDRKANIEQAKCLLQEFSEIVQASSVYETAAWGIENQMDFYNQLIEIKTELSPYQLLRKCISIEKKMGRQREFKWGPRIIDLDIIFYCNKIIFSPDLIIPHNFFRERRFILEPINEYWPNMVDPLSAKTMQEILALCEDNSKVNRLQD